MTESAFLPDELQPQGLKPTGWDILQSKNISRRSLLNGALAATGGLALAGVFLREGIDNQRNATEIARYRTMALEETVAAAANQVQEGRQLGDYAANDMLLDVTDRTIGGGFKINETAKAKTYLSSLTEEGYAPAASSAVDIVLATSLNNFLVSNPNDIPAIQDIDKRKASLPLLLLIMAANRHIIPDSQVEGLFNDYSQTFQVGDVDGTGRNVVYRQAKKIFSESLKERGEEEFAGGIRYVDRAY